MFTGIITDIGTIAEAEQRGDLRLRIQCGYDMSSVDLGASIACSGVCLTVVDKGADWFAVDLSAGTVSRTAKGLWNSGARLNLERSLKLGEEMGAPEWYEILQGVVEAMKPYARHGLNVNVDFYSGVIYQLHGIPMDLYVPIFAIGRMPGWIIQCIEQQEGNILIRPLTLYNGPEPRDYVAMGDR